MTRYNFYLLIFLSWAISIYYITELTKSTYYKYPRDNGDVALGVKSVNELIISWKVENEPASLTPRNEEADFFSFDFIFGFYFFFFFL